MRRIAPGLVVAMAALAFLASPAQGHITLSAVQPTEPLTVGVPMPILVTASKSCPTVLTEYQLMGETEIYFGLLPPHPAYLNATSDRVPFTVNQCSTSPADQGNAITTGNLYLVASTAAPGLTNLTVTVVTYGNDPSVPEGGSPVNLTFQVAYYANGTLSAGPVHVAPDANGTSANATATTSATGTTSPGGHGGASSGGHGGMSSASSSHDAPTTSADHDGQGTESKAITFPVNVEYATNAPSVLSFKVTTNVGKVEGLEDTPVSPPAAAGKESDGVELEASFEPPEGNWTTADILITAFLTPTVGGDAVEVGRTHVSLKAPPAEDHDASQAHDEGGKDSPGFGGLAAVSLLAAIAMALRRR